MHRAPCPGGGFSRLVVASNDATLPRAPQKRNLKAKSSKACSVKDGLQPNRWAALGFGLISMVSEAPIEARRIGNAHTQADEKCMTVYDSEQPNGKILIKRACCLELLLRGLALPLCCQKTAFDAMPR